MTAAVVCCRGLLARAVITAQTASPIFTHVYAALVAIINTKVAITRHWQLHVFFIVVIPLAKF